MPIRPVRVPVVLGLLAFFAFQARAQPIPIPDPTPTFRPEPYEALTDTKFDVANFNPEPMTGIALDSEGRAWMINPYGSTLLRYTNIQPTPDILEPTGNNPVSLAVWEPGEPTDRKILVVCVGTHGVFLHNGVTGVTEDFLLLDSEPGDIVIDPDHDWAFISCRGSNTVVQVDLNGFTILERFAIPGGQRPGPLYLDRGAPENENDHRVYVAATVTGNNSVFLLGAPGSIAGSVIDLDGNPGGELPDEDLFRIDPFAKLVDPVVRGLGSLIFDIDRNPADGALWVLSSESNNKDLTLATEPKVRGQVVVNQLKVVPGVGNGTTLVQAPDGIDLDDFNPGLPGAQYDPSRSVNQARTMDFLDQPDGEGRLGFIASPLSDVIVITDVHGDRVSELQLPAKSQCYSVKIYDPADGILFALCLGNMTFEVFFWRTQSTPVASLPLGFDPTKDQVKRGRDVFLNGKHSEDGRSSCQSCHPGGGSDLLGWSIAGEPDDFKDVMVTQSLLSIFDTFPHHWRGERDLLDFKKAFRGLLGADDVASGSLTVEPTDDEMADFVVFMQSLQAPANPLQSPRRRLEDNRTSKPAPNGMRGSAVNGQRVFRDVQNFNNKTCVACHSFESGSNGNMFAEVVSQAPRAVNVEVAHLRMLHQKGLATLSVDLGGGNIQKVNENGFGVLHDGREPSVFDFIFNGFLQLTPQQRVDTFNFVQQFDNGGSPAMHYGIHFDSSSPNSTRNRINNILLKGADKEWNDVVAFGQFDRNAGGGLEPMRWWYDPSAVPDPGFISEDPSVGALTWDDMKTETEAGRASNVFLGLPPKNGRRFGIDFDNDGLINGQEALLLTLPWDPDSDDDGWPDGYEFDHGDSPTTGQTISSDDDDPVLLSSTLDFESARVAKYHVTFDEDVKYVVNYSVTDGLTVVNRTFERDYYSRQDTFVLTHSEPSSGFPNTPLLSYDATITYTDRNDNVTGPEALPSFNPERTQDDIFAPIFVHVSSMEWEREDRVGGVLDGQIKIKINSALEGPTFLPAADFMVFCIVSIHDSAANVFNQSNTFTTPHQTGFSLAPGGIPTPYTATPGPFIVSDLTDANGETVINFQQSGLLAGQIVKVSVMGTLTEAQGQPPNTFNGNDIRRLQPLTLGRAAEIVSPVP